MTVSEWHAEAMRLRDAGLYELADFYADNARRRSRGEPIVWPIPPELLASRRLADKPNRPAFADDGREDA